MEHFLALSNRLPWRSPSGRPMTRSHARRHIRHRPRPAGLDATGVHGWFNPAIRRRRLFAIGALLSAGTTVAGVSLYMLKRLYNYLQSNDSPPPSNTALSKAFSSVMAYFKRYRGFTAARRYRRRAMRMSRRRVRRSRRVAPFAGGYGPLQKRMGRRRVNRRLNTNVKRNDYDSVREIFRLSTVVASDTTAITASSSFQVGDGTVALSKLFDYNEYRIDNIQMLIEQVNIPLGGAYNLKAFNATEQPLIFIIPRVHVAALGTFSWKDLLTTPGIIRLPMLFKGKKVINLSPSYYEVDETIVATSGFKTVHNPLKKVGWMHNLQTVGPIVAANYFDYGSHIIFMPQLATGSFLPEYNVQMWATATFRGNRTLVQV